MKFSMKLFVTRRPSGQSSVVEVAGIIHQDASAMTEHDLAGVLFACEFAINNNASQIFGHPVRAHIMLEPE